MTTELATTEKNLPILNWSDEQQCKDIRASCCKNFNDTEFAQFVGMAKATGLNPFLREIWGLKYDTSGKVPPSIFVARDGFRKIANRNSDYEYHQVDAVYSNDTFKVVNGEHVHEYGIAKRGVLMGAYCTVKRKSSPKPFFVYLELAEYDLNQSVWKTKKATMIKKCAEAQCLRATFPADFNGLSSDAEKDHIMKDITPEHEKTSRVDELKETIAPKKESVTIEAEPTKTPLEVKKELMHKLMYEKKMSDEKLTDALNHYKVDHIDSMSEKNLEDFIQQLGKM